MGGGDGLLGTRGARLWLLVGFVLGFGSLIAAIWIMFAVFVIPKDGSVYTGLAFFMQNFFIFLA